MSQRTFFGAQFGRDSRFQSVLNMKHLSFIIPHYVNNTVCVFFTSPL